MEPWDGPRHGLLRRQVFGAPSTGTACGRRDYMVTSDDSVIMRGSRRCCCRSEPDTSAIGACSGQDGHRPRGGADVSPTRSSATWQGTIPLSNVAGAHHDSLEGHAGRCSRRATRNRCQPPQTGQQTLGYSQEDIASCGSRCGDRQEAVGSWATISRSLRLWTVEAPLSYF